MSRLLGLKRARPADATSCASSSICVRPLTFSHKKAASPKTTGQRHYVKPRAPRFSQASNLKKESDYVPIGDDVISAFAPQLPGRFQRCPPTYGD